MNQTRRTKLEMSLDILEVFVNHGPIRLTRVSQKAKVNYVLLKKITKGLLSQRLLEERKTKNYVAYVATPEAHLVLARLRENAKSFHSLVECAASADQLAACSNNDFLLIDRGSNVLSLSKNSTGLFMVGDRFFV